MILHTVFATSFAVNPDDDGKATVAFQDNTSAQAFQFPLDPESVVNMALQLAGCMTLEQRRKCAPAFNGGIHLPNGPIGPADLGMNPDGPPR